MLWLVVLVLVPVATVAYLLHKHNILRQVWLTADMRGPRAYPVIGNGLLFLNKSAIGGCHFWLACLNIGINARS